MRNHNAMNVPTAPAGASLVVADMTSRRQQQLSPGLQQIDDHQPPHAGCTPEFTNSRIGRISSRKENPTTSSAIANLIDVRGRGPQAQQKPRTPGAKITTYSGFSDCSQETGSEKFRRHRQVGHPVCGKTVSVEPACSKIIQNSEAAMKIQMNARNPRPSGGIAAAAGQDLAEVPDRDQAGSGIVIAVVMAPMVLWPNIFSTKYNTTPRSRASHQNGQRATLGPGYVGARRAPRPC